MVSALVFLAVSQGNDGVAVLKNLRDEYQKLSSFSMNIEHHESSGLFPGNYKQSFAWSKGRFELRVTKTSDAKPEAGKPGSLAPDYFCEGKEVVSRQITGQTSTRELNRDPNILPGYEVAGGMIVSWLLKSPNADMLFNPPKGFEVGYELGAQTRWHEMDAKELKITIKSGGQGSDVRFLLSPDLKSLVGFEWKREGKTGWAIYSDQKRDPKLSDTLGTFKD